MKRWVVVSLMLLGGCTMPYPTPPPRLDDTQARMLAEYNRIRQGLGLSTVQADDRLTIAAQEHAEALAADRARPHAGFPQRLFDAGFPRINDVRIDPRMAGNVSEGVSWGSALLPEDGVEILNDRGAHGTDFRSGWTHVGLGHATSRTGAYYVLDYGWLPPKGGYP